MNDTARLNIGKARAAPKKKRAGKAVRLIKEKVKRRTDYKDIKISNNLNEKIWERGGKPPSKIDVQFIGAGEKLIVDTSEADVSKTV